jgi:hypothetical protein
MLSVTDVNAQMLKRPLKIITEFTLADAERHRQITTQKAGYHHSASAATSAPPVTTGTTTKYYC